MGKRLGLIAITCIGLLIAAIAAAQPEPPAPPAASPGVAAGAPAAATPTLAPAVPEIETKVIPGEKVGPLPLDAMLDFMKEKVPGFNSVIVRAPDVVNDYPTLPQMTLKNVTVGQFLELLRTSFAGVDINRIDGPQQPIYVVRIQMANGVPSVAQQAQEQANAAAMAAAKANGVPPPSFAPGGGVPDGYPLPGSVDFSPQVKVYRLGDLVSALSGTGPGSDKSKQSLNDVLSLVQAALDQLGGKDDTVLKVHEPTQTLVFKGSPRKMAVLEQVLATLEPKPEAPNVTQYRRQIEDLSKQYDSQRTSDRQRIDALQDELQKRTVESTKLDEQVTILRTELEETRARLLELRAQLDKKNSEPAK